VWQQSGVGADLEQNRSRFGNIEEHLAGLKKA